MACGLRVVVDVVAVVVIGRCCSSRNQIMTERREHNTQDIFPRLIRSRWSCFGHQKRSDIGCCTKKEQQPSSVMVVATSNPEERLEPSCIG